MGLSLFAQTVDSVTSFSAEAANQAVAADKDYLYAIDNRTIEKYDKETGQLIKKWTDTSGAIQHLNSGIVINHRLYCAHSNFPGIPMVSSIEVFNTKDLSHVGSHSFGIDIGSATWIDWYNGHWYVAFAHYDRFKKQTGKGNRWSQLVKYTPKWERVGGWILPETLYERFGKMSNSGGVITPDGTLFLTGHDFKELYKMKFPTKGSVLRWVNTLPAPFEGQGIALDPENNKVVYGIIRSKKRIVKGTLKSYK